MSNSKPTFTHEFLGKNLPVGAYGGEQKTPVSEQELSLHFLTKEALPAPQETTPTHRKIGVFICHGMGEQVPYETISGIASIFARQNPNTPVVSRLLNSDGTWIARAEVKCPKGNGREEDVDVHVYEGYWAPLTEGKIGLVGAIGFLFGAAKQGILSWMTNRGFNRWTFGTIRDYPLKPMTFGALFLALITLALFLGEAVVAILLTFQLIAPWLGWHPAFFPDDRIASIENGLFYSPLGVGLAAVVSKPIWDRLAHYPAMMRWAGLAMVWVAFAFMFFSGIRLLDILCFGGEPLADFLPQPPWWMLRIAWIAGALELLAFRYFLIEYVGDVAIYVSSYKVDAYDGVRDAIQQRCMKVARFIYSLKQPGGKFVYDHLIVIGHSLGSVVSYDTLNGLIREDLAGTAHNDVIARTKLFLTFGSPLDKTAFLFRTQTDNTPIRESLAGAMQPLIVSYGNRPPWKNIYSKLDWISGSLDYYDLPAPGVPALPVENVEDRQCTLPLLAHNQYWNNDLLASILLKALK